MEGVARCSYLRETMELSRTEYCSTGSDRYSCAAVLKVGKYKDDEDNEDDEDNARMRRRTMRRLRW